MKKPVSKFAFQISTCSATDWTSAQRNGGARLLGTTLAFAQSAATSHLSTIIISCNNAVSAVVLLLGFLGLMDAFNRVTPKGVILGGALHVDIICPISHNL